MQSCVLAVNQLSSTDKHRSQLVYSRESHKEVCWGLLFLMYINDIAEGVTSQMRMFADDSIVYRQIHTPADYFTLASDLNKLSGGYHQHKIIVSTTYQQSAEQSKQDNWFTQKNTARAATEILVRPTLSLPHAPGHLTRRQAFRQQSAYKDQLRGYSPVITAELHVSVICALT